MRLIDATAGIAGFAVVATATHMNVEHAGGYGSPDAGLIIAIAALVVIGMGYAAIKWREGTRLGSAVLVLCLLAGESYWTATNTDRELKARMVAEAPIEKARAKRAALTKEVADARAAKKEADDAALTQAALPGCKKECAKLLTQAKHDAETELTRKQGELAALPEPPIGEALADHLSLPHWAYDLIMAGFRALAIMGGSVMIGLAVHPKHKESPPPAAPGIPVPIPAMAMEILPPMPAIAAPIGSVKRFLLSCVSRAKGEEVTAGALYARYQRWCADSGFSPMKPREFAEEFKEIAARVGIRTRIDGSKIYCRDVKLAA